MSFFDYDKYTGKKEKSEEKKTSSGFFDYEKYTRGTPMVEPGGKNLFESVQDFQRQSEARPSVQPATPKELPGRDIPVIGPVLRTLDKVQKFTEPAAKVAEQLYTPGAGPAAVAGISRGVGTVLSRLAPSIGRGTGAGAKVARGAISEAVTGVPVGVGQTLASNPGASNKELAEGAALGAGLGAVGGAAVPALGKAAKAIADRAGLTDKLTSYVTRHRSVNPEVEQATRDIMQPRKIGIASGPLRNASNEQYINKVMSDIRPIVNERMTPPLENPNELAKWLQPHLDTSLNQIRKLPYDDMVELANEVKGHMSMYDVAKNVAKERGYNLDDILSNKTPDIGKTADRLRMGRVAGAIEPPNKNVRVAVSPEYQPSAPVTPPPIGRLSLFGEQNLGITPFGSARSNRMVSTEQQIVRNPLAKDVRGFADSAKQTAKGTYQNAVDFVAPLKKINRQTYDSAIDAARANNLANSIIRDKFVDNQGQVIGKSLDEIMKNSRGLGKKVDDYLVLRHAVTRMKRGERVYDEALNMTPEKAEAQVKLLEQRYPQLAQIGKDWDEFNTNLLDSGVREGLISQAARDVMRKKNPNYASMRRQFSASEKLAQPRFGNGGSAFSGQKAPIKEVSPTGSTRKIISPLRSAIEQTYAWKNAELRNRTMQEIVRAIQRDSEGMKSIAEIVKKPSTSYKSLDDALREGGSEEFLEQLDNDFKSLFKQHNPGQENVVRAMVNGNPVFIKVSDPEAVKALLGMGSESSGFILGALQKLSNATKRGATGLLAPMFAVKNLTADTVQAAIQSPNTIKHLTIDLPHALISSLAEAFKIPELRNLADEFRRAGGEYSSLLRGDRQLNRSVSSLRREAPLSTRGIAKGAVLGVKAPFKALEKLADVTENANRMAAFRRDILGKDRTPTNVRNAINAARESTTNFSRRGAFGRETEAVIPYSNAAIQGLYRMSKSLIQHPVKTLTGIGTLVVVPKFIEFSRFGDDPDYQKLPARERYRNLFISKNADGTFTKVPMAPEYNAFGALFTDILDRAYNDDPQAFKGSLDALANAYTPPFMSGSLQGVTQGGGLEQSIKGAINSTVAAPFVAIAGNQSFTGSPIVPQRLQDRSPKFQYDERTSSVAKVIGEKTGWSPMKVDYLIRAYGGDPSRLLLPLTSDAGAGTPRNTLLRNFIADPVFTNTLADDFYTARDKLSQARNDHSDVGEPLPEWFSERAYDLINSQKKGSPSKHLSALNAQKRTINGDKTLSAQEKAQQLRDLQSQINEIYLDVNTKLQEMGVPFKGR